MYNWLCKYGLDELHKLNHPLGLIKLPESQIKTEVLTYLFPTLVKNVIIVYKIDL